MSSATAPRPVSSAVAATRGRCLAAPSYTAARRPVVVRGGAAACRPRQVVRRAAVRYSPRRVADRLGFLAESTCFFLSGAWGAWATYAPTGYPAAASWSPPRTGSVTAPVADG